MAIASRVDVDAKNKLYAWFKPEWDMIEDCIAGERAVKFKQTKYLPHPSSQPELDKGGKRYRDYLLRAPFLNATGRTQAAMLGVAFQKAPVVKLEGALSIFETDVDRSKQPLTQQIRDAMAATLAKGRFGLFPDFSVPTTYDETGQPVELTVEQAATARPLIRLFYADQIINWRVTDGEDTLIVAKYTDEVDDPVGFNTNEVTVWLELRLVNGIAYARRHYQNQSGGLVQTSGAGFSQTPLMPILDQAGVPLKKLPWAWGGAVNNDAFPDAAPLADIASLNIKHYQSEADVAEYAHIVGQPMPVISGLTQVWVDKNISNGIVFGSTSALLLPVGGQAELLQAEERNASTLLCERREQQMAKIGASLVERGTAPKTATEAEFDAQTDNSILSLCATNVEMAYNSALEIAAQFNGGSGSVQLNKRYTQAVVDSQVLAQMMAGVQSGNILIEDWVRWMQSQGIADEHASVEEIIDLLRNQEPIGLANTGNMQYDANGNPIDPNANPNPPQGE